ncbi:MAG TPA: NAD-dependent deacylase [bacterium]
MISNRLIQHMKNAGRVAVLTGAGVSAESGVPTFRGEDGLWKKFRPEELASIDAFMANPELVWEWYSARRQIVREKKPNPGHMALAEMESIFREFTLITQNVDGFHQRAGSRNVLELHGNILFSKCIRCGAKSDRVEFSIERRIPLCPCGGQMRPDVVWFGEALPQDVLVQAFEASKHCDVFFSIGTSAVVHPAASLPLAAKQAGALIVEINTERTALSDFADEMIIGKSGEVLPELVEQLKTGEMASEQI